MVSHHAELTKAGYAASGSASKPTGKAMTNMYERQTSTTAHTIGISHIRCVRQHQFITIAIGPKYIAPSGRQASHGIKAADQLPLTLVASGTTKYIWPSAKNRLKAIPDFHASFRVA